MTTFMNFHMTTFVNFQMKVTHQINIQRLVLFEWLNFRLITYMWNLMVMSISRLLVFHKTTSSDLTLILNSTVDFVKYSWSKTQWQWQWYDNDFISNIHTYLQITYLQVSYLHYHCCELLGDQQYSINAVLVKHNSYVYASQEFAITVKKEYLIYNTQHIKNIRSVSTLESFDYFNQTMRNAVLRSCSQ